jgi:hypothetical protein
MMLKTPRITPTIATIHNNQLMRRNHAERSGRSYIVGMKNGITTLQLLEE